ncbi:MAG: hypothetical protein LBL46_04980 [Rickettsiales bacterium]|jgi:hypothetical protein|nr:hypothetical protein [Rickettsiales bacterium]
MKKIAIFFAVLVGAGGVARADIQGALTGLASGNQTSFQNNQGIVNNNQYNQAMNPNRVGGGAAGTAATANFGNCDALMQRCAAGRCGNGGCADMNVAFPIVQGCVAASAECKKHGDALAQSVAAQMVASSVQKNNAASAQQQQQMAAQNAAQSAQQMEQMNQQMAAMQAQMAQQQQASQQQMQEMMAQQAAQQQAAMAQQAELMKQQQASAPSSPPAASPAAAIPAAPVQQSIDSGVSADAIARNQIVGQVLSSLDGVDASIKNLDQTVRDVLNYAKCDYNANSCEGPRRVAAFRKKAQNFFEPYDGVLDALENSLYTAMAAGIDVSDIYMMLTNSCTQWGKYLCNYKNDNPMMYCKSKTGVQQETTGQIYRNTETNKVTGDDRKTEMYTLTGTNNARENCVSAKTDVYQYQVQNPNCNFVELYRNDQRDEVQQNYILANSDDATNIRMSCMSDGLLQSGIFARRGRQKSKDFDIDALEIVINQEEPRNSTGAVGKTYCSIDGRLDDAIINLQTMLSKKKYTNIVGTATPDATSGLTGFSGNKDCWDTNSGCFAYQDYAMCSTHVYNIGLENNDKTDTPASGLTDENRKKMNEIIALKSTVIAQQLKKQKDYLASIVKQIKTQMQKAVLAAKAEAAGAKSGNNSSSSAASAVDCGGKRGQDLISCISNARSALQSMSSTDFGKACNSIKLALNSAGIPPDQLIWKESSTDTGIALCADTSQGKRQIQMSLIDKGVTDLSNKERAASMPPYRYP